MRPILSEFSKTYVKVLAVLILLVSIFGVVHTAGAQSSSLRDCDTNAVIHCGALSINELTDKVKANSGNIQAIYQAMGIPAGQSFSGMVDGTVTRDGRVLVDNKVVATDAITAGRVNMPGSTPIAGGLAFKRPPSVSFAAGHDSLSALVMMSNQGFKFAVINSCGNPVMAKPVAAPAKPKPNFTVTKLVRLQGSGSDFMEGITANQKDTVEFQVVIKNTGNTTLTNVRLRDALPGGLTSSTSLVSGMTVGTMAPGTSHTEIFSAVVGSTVQACGTNRLRNVVTATANKLPAKQAVATVQVCPPQVLSSITPAAATPQPASLAKTGTDTGQLVGIFSAVSTAAAFGYRWLLRLRRI